MSRPSLLRSLASFSGMTMVSRVFGLLRDIVISTVFGANQATDAFWVAFRIPSFLRRLFAEGSFATAFVPVLTEVKQTRGEDEVRRLIARTGGALGGVLLIVVAAGILFAPQVTLLFTPGAIAEPVKFELTAALLRITFPFLLFISLTALAGSVLNSYHRFALPAVTPALGNLCMIAGALWIAPHLRVPIMALGWATLAGGVLQLLVLLPALRSLRLLDRLRWGWGDPDVRRILRLMGPTLFSSSVAQISLLLDTLIASFLIAGSQSWLSQSDRLLEFPLGVFGVAMGTVILPSLSRHHVGTDRAGFSRALDWGLRTALLICVPAMLALIVLAEPIVAALFLHGHFSAFDAHMTVLSLSALSLGLPAFALVKVVLPAFYSRQDTRSPMRAALTALAANMVMNLLFVGVLFALWRGSQEIQAGWLEGVRRVPGLHMALSLSSAVAGYINLALLWRFLRRDAVYAAQPGWARHAVRLGLACAAMVVVLLAGMALWPDWTQYSTTARIARLATLMIVGAAAYASALFASGFRLRELRGI